MICKNKNCKATFEGRANRKYCSPECKEAVFIALRKKKDLKRKKEKEQAQNEKWGPPTDWGDLSTWEPTPEAQKAWEDELAKMPTLEDLWEDLKRGKK